MDDSFAGMRIAIVTPAVSGSRTGNETTTERWRAILSAAGHQVDVLRSWDGETCDVLIALHARKSGSSILRFHERCPEAPVIVALTGTDIYGDLGPETARSIAVATRLVVLQPLALRELPETAWSKTWVVYQSVSPMALPRPARATFDVCVLAHLRAVKDPFRAAIASRFLPAESRMRILQIGGALDPGTTEIARAEEEGNERYRWLGRMPRVDALQVVAGCDVMVISSEREGGANAVSEAISLSVPVIASRIPGNAGLLGEDYPGFFEVGDTAELARLLHRAEADASFLQSLQIHCRRRMHLFDPAREEATWRALLEESCGAASAISQSRRLGA